MIAAAVLLIIILGIITGYVEKWLWMRQLDYAGIFWTLLSVQWAMFCSAFVFAFLYLWVSLRQAVRNSAAFRGDGPVAQTGIDFSPRLLKLAVGVISAGVALFFAAGFYAQWDTYLRFRYGGSFGVSDPLFGVDVGFYLFHLPFYSLLQTSLMLLTVLALAAVVLTYVFFGLLRLSGSGKIAAAGNATSHLSQLLFILVANWGFGLYLDHYNLVYSTLGVVYGAGYTADHVTRIALWIMVAVSAVACALLALNFFRPRFRALLLGSGIYVGLYIVGILLFPVVVQKFFVQPSELALETPYLKNNIEFTRKAYQLEAIQETSYPALADLTPAAVARNEDTIQNIRLWDARPLLQTYQQTQAIRLYYQFHNVGVDRYHLADGYHQVMLATRELSPELPESANLGQSVSAVHPWLWSGHELRLEDRRRRVSGIPSRERPCRIGVWPEHNPASDLLRGIDAGLSDRCNRHQRVRLPQGQRQCLHQLQRKRGHPAGQLLEKAPICLDSERRQHPFDLLSHAGKPHPDLADGSRARCTDRSVLAPRHRSLPGAQRGQAVLDPGCLYDSDQFPYSYPHGTSFGDNLNYLKLGKGRCGHVRRDCSVLRHGPQGSRPRRLSTCVPRRFQDLDQLSADLKDLRYPEDLFAIQADQYKTFHMTDPQVFYNREDLSGRSQGELCRQVAADGALLHPDEAPRKRPAGVPSDDAFYAAKPGQHDFLDGGEVRFPRDTQKCSSTSFPRKS